MCGMGRIAMKASTTSSVTAARARWCRSTISTSTCEWGHINGGALSGEATLSHDPACTALRPLVLLHHLHRHLQTQGRACKQCIEELLCYMESEAALQPTGAAPLSFTSTLRVGQMKMKGLSVERGYTEPASTALGPLVRSTISASTCDTAELKRNPFRNARLPVSVEK